MAAVSGTQLASARDEERNPEVALSRDLNVAAKAWTALKRDPGKAQIRPKRWLRSGDSFKSRQEKTMTKSQPAGDTIAAM